MAELSGSAPLRSSAWSAVRPPSQATPEGATARAARLYNRELGELNRLQRVAQLKGEVVTEAQIALEYESQGPKLIARDASSTFQSREPQQSPAEQRAVEAPATPPAAPVAAAATTPAEIVAVREQVSERVSKLNQSLSLSTAAAPQPAEPDSALDATV